MTRMCYGVVFRSDYICGITIIQMKHPLTILAASLSLALSVSLHAAPASYGDRYRFTHIDRSWGLSYNAVKCMAQDSRGFVWIGTYKGLNRYDGVRIKSYDRLDMGVDSDYINVLAEDSAGNILIGTDNGIVIYDYVLDDFRRPAGSDILDDRVYDICMDSDGTMWIGSRSQGLFRYDSGTDELSAATVIREDGSVLDNVYRIAIDSNDRMYMVSYCDNIYCMDIGADSAPVRLVVECPDFFEGDDVEGLCVSPRADYLVYVASKRHGLCEVNTMTGKVKMLHAISADSRPVGLDIGGKDLWLSTTSGLVRYDIAVGSCSVLRQDSNDRFSLSDDYVNCVLIDDMDGLWVGTAYHGVNYHGVHQDLFGKFYRTDDGESLEGSEVCDFAQDGDGNVWIATERKGLFLYCPETDRLTAYRLPIRLDHINALYCDGDWLWLGYHNGICRMNRRDRSVVSYPHFSVSDVDVDNRVLDIFMSSDGLLYVCTSIGMMKYDSALDSFCKVECLGDGAIEHVLEDGRGTIWVASYSSGVYAYDRFADRVAGHWCVRDGDGSIPEMTSSVCIDEDGQVWIVGFGSGFFRYDQKKKDFDAYDRAGYPALPTDIFFSALPDDNGNLWLSSDRGLVRFDRNTGSVAVYNVLSGILDDDFRKSCIRLGDGSMLFGSSDGFIRFSPGDFRTDLQPVEVSVTDFLVGDMAVVPSESGPVDRNIDIAGHVRLEADSNSFGFRLASHISGSLAGGSVKCMLAGYDSLMVDVPSNMEVYWYNIPPGDYVFKVVSSGQNGLTTAAHKDIRVEILPEFWQSRTGIALIVAMSIAVCVAVFIMIYMRMEQRHRSAQEEMERRKEKEMLQEKMSFFSNIVHEIKTPLTLIRTPLQNIMASGVPAYMKEELAIIANSTDCLDRLVKELLDFIRIEKHGYVLEYRNIDVIDRINYMLFNFSETVKNRNLRMTFSHGMDRLEVAVDPKALDKILNNLLHNAVKYAGSWISLTVEAAGGNMTVTVANDGKPIPQERRTEIFKPFVQFSEDPGYSGSFGIGLSFARMLAELHGGSLVLADGRKTAFVLTLPLKSLRDRQPEQSEDGTLPDDADRSLPMLLLVEDNYDLQAYLKRKLSVRYNVITADSGEKALSLIGKHKVDMILTDIVLQGMDGVELCRRVSRDMETSHIPVIVLSAISSVDVKVRAMESGAVNYIEKPFTMDYLMACISGVLDKRRQLKEALRNEPASVVDMAPFNLVSRDEAFLKRLEAVVGENMSNSSFSVARLEDAMYMSRSSLTRKMKGLLNTTPVEYLRARRLSVAAEMLKSGKYHINEVCYAVGFASPSYFAKCFRAMYGKLPGEYAETSGPDAVEGDDKSISPKDDTN